MFFKKKKIFLFLIFFSTQSFAEIKDNLIKNLEKIESYSFIFEQNINGKIEKGKCKISYPKKIFCEYDNKTQKILVSNGKSLVIKTSNSFYIYPLNKTPLNLILDKGFLIKKIKTLDERIIENKFINFNFIENENEINIFFDKDTFNLIGWQTLDIYQKLSITHLKSITKNQKIKKSLFKLPKQD